MTGSNGSLGLPVPNPTKSYWQTPPHRIANHRSTATLPPSNQYAIVGSGITGASIAYKILLEDPTASIVMLEARQAASGASGRNGGHCRSGRYLSFKDDLRNFGLEDALRLEKLEETNVRNVGEFIKHHDIECDLREVETVDIFTDAKELEEALASLEARKEAFSGRPDAQVLTEHKVWSEKETKEDLLVPKGLGAISFRAFALSPYKFVCALLEMAMDEGLNLQTNTPVAAISQIQGPGSNNQWVLHTKRGHILADKVILATNAYTAALYPPLADFIIPTRGQVAAVRPGSNIAENPALLRTCGLNSAESGDYFQSRAKGFSGAGDIIVGGGRLFGTGGEQPILDDSTINSNISKYLTRQTLTRYFGEENWGRNGEVLMEWTGIMGYTFDRQPIVGESPDQRGLWICAGFNGHGMALTFESAEALVQLLMGKEKQVDEWLPKCYRLSRISQL